MKNVKSANYMQMISPSPDKKKMSIRETNKQATQERFLDAALELFEELGFSAVTVNQIMKRANANRATFYLHFKDKLDIAWLLGKRQVGAQNTMLFHELDSIVDPTPEKVRAWVARRMSVISASPTLIHVINEAITSEPQFAREYISYLSRVADRVMVNLLGSREGIVRELARSKFIFMVMLMDRYVLHVEYQRLDMAGTVSDDALAEMLWDALFRKQPAV